MLAEKLYTVEKLNSSLLDNGFLFCFNKWIPLGRVATSDYDRNWEFNIAPREQGVYIIGLMVNLIIYPVYCGSTSQRGGVRQRLAQHVQMPFNDSKGYYSGVLKAVFKLGNPELVWYFTFVKSENPSLDESKILARYDFICCSKHNGGYRFNDLVLLNGVNNIKKRKIRTVVI